MKALLLKDIFSLRRQFRVLLCIIGLYTFLSILQKNIGFLTAMITLLSVMLPITAQAYDETSSWEKYALSMPITRKQLVGSKYLLGFLAGFVGTVFSIFLHCIVSLPQHLASFSEIMLTSFLALEAGLLFLSILFPILFRFGVEKGRILMAGIVFLPFIIVLLMGKSGISFPALSHFSLFFSLSPCLIGLLFGLSFWISLHIYGKKEF